MFFLIVPLAMAYLTMVGFVFTKMDTHYKSTCKYKNKGWCDGDCGHVAGSVFAAAFWPVALPITVGVLAGKGEGLSRTQKRHAKEIHEAAHKLEVATINAKTTAALELALKD